jgi:hypothetical protein
VKFNVDAETSKNGVTVARDDSGLVIHCWSKSFPTTDPLIAETAALLWALEIARDNRFSHILIEGDAKICIEALAAEPEKVPWRIQTLVSNIKCVALDFNVCSFCWVPRDVNALAHSFAKFASSQDFCFLCNSTNLPPWSTRPGLEICLLCPLNITVIFSKKNNFFFVNHFPKTYASLLPCRFCSIFCTIL